MAFSSRTEFHVAVASPLENGTNAASIPDVKLQPIFQIVWPPLKNVIDAACTTRNGQHYFGFWFFRDNGLNK